MLLVPSSYCILVLIFDGGLFEGYLGLLLVLCKYMLIKISHMASDLVISIHFRVMLHPQLLYLSFTVHTLLCIGYIWIFVEFTLEG